MQRTGDVHSAQEAVKAEKAFDSKLAEAYRQIDIFERQHGGYRSALERREHLLGREVELCNGGILRVEREIKLRELGRNPNPWADWRSAAQEERFRIERSLAPARKAVSEAEAALRAWEDASFSRGYNSMSEEYRRVKVAYDKLKAISPPLGRRAMEMRNDRLRDVL